MWWICGEGGSFFCRAGSVLRLGECGLSWGPAWSLGLHIGDNITWWLQSAVDKTTQFWAELCYWCTGAGSKSVLFLYYSRRVKTEYFGRAVRFSQLMCMMLLKGHWVILSMHLISLYQLWSNAVLRTVLVGWGSHVFSVAFTMLCACIKTGLLFWWHTKLLWFADVQLRWSDHSTQGRMEEIESRRYWGNFYYIFSIYQNFIQ